MRNFRHKLLSITIQISTKKASPNSAIRLLEILVSNYISIRDTNINTGKHQSKHVYINIQRWK